MAAPLGVAEKVYYAQQIVDAYTKALDSDNCLSKVPQAIYAQAEIYEQTLTDVLDSLSQEKEHETEWSYTYTAPEDSQVVQLDVNKQESLRNQNLVNSIKSRLNQECIPCGIPKPVLNLRDIFANITVNIKAFIDLINGILGRLNPSFCHFAYLLSFLCIPDLVKILAIILARILQLTSAIALGTFSIGAFIFAIIGSILRALLQFVLGMLNVAIAPITCLLQSIETALNKIPTEDVMRRRLGNDEYRLIYGKDKPPPGPSPVDQYQNKANAQFAEVTTKIREEFGKVSSVLRSASAGIDEAIQELFGLKNFMECEPERASSNIFQKIEALVDLIQMANLLRALIKAKVKRTVVDELCRYKEEPISSTQPLTPGQLALVLEEATDKVVDIIESDGNPVGLIVRPGTETNPENLSIWSCNMADFMRSSDLNNLIEEAVAVVQADLKGPEFANDPKKYIDFSYNNLARYTPRFNQSKQKPRDRTTIKYSDVFLPNKLADFVHPVRNVVTNVGPAGTNSDPANDPTFEVVLFDTPDGLSQPLEIINQIFGYIPLQNKSMLNFFTVEEADREKLVQAKNDSIKNRASGNLAYNSYIINNSILQSAQPAANAVIDVEIPVIGGNVGKAAQIKCGTIENIRSNFDLLK